MEKFDMLIEPLRALLAQVGAFVPRLALAVVVLIGGWLLAKVARFAIVKALRAINFNVLTERAGIDGFLEQGGIRTDMTGIFGGTTIRCARYATVFMSPKMHKWLRNLVVRAGL